MKLKPAPVCVVRKQRRKKEAGHSGLVGWINRGTDKTCPGGGGGGWAQDV